MLTAYVTTILDTIPDGCDYIEPTNPIIYFGTDWSTAYDAGMGLAKDLNGGGFQIDMYKNGVWHNWVVFNSEDIGFFNRNI